MTTVDGLPETSAALRNHMALLDLCQVLNLSCNCLSFDFMGTIPDDTSDEQGTVGAQNSQGWEKRILWFGGSIPHLHLEPVDHLDLKTVILWVQNKAPNSHQFYHRFFFFLVLPIGKINP